MWVHNRSHWQFHLRLNSSLYSVIMITGKLFRTYPPFFELLAKLVECPRTPVSTSQLSTCRSKSVMIGACIYMKQRNALWLSSERNERLLVVSILLRNRQSCVLPLQHPLWHAPYGFTLCPLQCEFYTYLLKPNSITYLPEYPFHIS